MSADVWTDYPLLTQLYEGERIGRGHVAEATKAIEEIQMLRDRNVYLRNLLRDRGIEVRAS
jgi:hypothetical protein